MEFYGNSGIGNLVAAAHVHVADNEGTGIPSYIGQPFGFLPPTIGVGLDGNLIFTLSPNSHIAPADSVVMVTLDGAVGELVSVEKVSETTNFVRIVSSLGATTISDFWIAIFRKGQ